MRRFFCLLLLGLMGLGVRAGAARGAELTPGLHENLATPADAQFHYDLYLPKAYHPAGGPDELLAAVLVTPPADGNARGWSKRNLSDWAEAHQVAVMTVATPVSEAVKLANKLGPAKSPAFLDAWMDAYVDVLAKTPGLHPHVRLSLNPGRNSTNWTWNTMLRHPNAFAGVAVNTNLNAPRPGAPLPPTHLAVALFLPSRLRWQASGPKFNDVYMGKIVEEYWLPRTRRDWDPVFKKNGTPVTQIGYADRDVLDGDAAVDALEYLLYTAWLTHPKVTKPQKQGALERFTREAEAARALNDPLARYRQLDLLTRVAGVDAATRKPLLEAFRAAAVDAADPQPDALARVEHLTALSADPRMAGTPELATINKKLAALRADPKVKQEIDAHAAAQELIWKSSSAYTPPPGAPKLPREAFVKALEAVVQKYPGTYGATEAQHRLDSIRTTVGK